MPSVLVCSRHTARAIKCLLLGWLLNLAGIASAQTLVPIPFQNAKASDTLLMGISRDGSFVSFNEFFNNTTNAAGWRPNITTGSFQLGSPNWALAQLYSMSGDGSTVGGLGDFGGFLSTVVGSTIHINVIEDAPHVDLYPDRQSKDGSVCYGEFFSGEDQKWETTRWTAATGLVDIPTMMVPACCSDDGSIAYGIDDTSTQALMWTQAGGVITLGAFSPVSCSRDGSTLVGLNMNDDTSLYVYNTTTGLTNYPLPAGDTIDNGEVFCTPEGGAVLDVLNASDGRVHPLLWFPSAGPYGFSAGFNDLGVGYVQCCSADLFRLFGADTTGYPGYYQMGLGWVDYSQALSNAGVSTSYWQYYVFSQCSDDGSAIAGRGVRASDGLTELCYATVPGWSANNDVYTFGSGPSLTVNQAGGVLANDSNAFGAAVQLVSSTANGALTLNADGSFIYTPTGAFSGNDSFTYQLSRGPITSNVATVNITSNAIAAFFAGQARLPGGGLGTGTVDLASPAPAGGMVVNLQSGNPAVLPVPSTVTVSGGGSAKSFSFRAESVSASTQVMVTAALGTSTASFTIWVDPSSIKTISFLPATAVGGNFVLAHVTLGVKNGATTQYISPDVSPNLINFSQFNIPPLQNYSFQYVNTLGVDVTTQVSVSFNGGAVTGNMTLNPATLSALTPLSSTVVGGQAVPITASLNGLAGPTNGDLTLQSSNTAIATTPASIQIGQNLGKAIFKATIGTGFSTATTVNISATQGSTTVTTTLNAVPALITALVLKPSTVKGGVGCQGIIYLDALAGTDGVTVNLTASDGNAAVPATVVVPAGKVFVIFPITTSSVSAVDQVTISASDGARSRTAVLTIDP